MKLLSHIVGRGLPVVLLHPFPLSADFWDGLKAPSGFRFILSNFPGFGASALGPDDFTLERAALSLQENLQELRTKESIVLAGISMGGYWAFEYLRQFQPRVSKLILISTRAGVDNPEGKQKRLDMAEKVEKEGTGFMAEAMIPGLLGQTTRLKKPEVVQRVSDWILKTPPAAVALAQRAMAQRRDQTDLLGKISVPTLIVAGAEDTLIPVSESENMSRAIRDSQLKILDGVGHLLPLEDPAQFEKIMDEFLLEHS